VSDVLERTANAYDTTPNDLYELGTLGLAAMAYAQSNALLARELKPRWFAYKHFCILYSVSPTQALSVERCHF